jgi:hypothetical protein
MYRFLGVLSVTLALFAQPPSESAKLWAGISVQQPVFQVAGIAALQMSFAVVNDGSSAVNPNIEASHLFINGVEPQNWSFIIGNGLRTPDFKLLPSGGILSFGYALGDLFLKPGTYTVRWESANFKSADVVFRVVATAPN